MSRQTARQNRSHARMMTDDQLHRVLSTFPAQIQQAQSLLTAVKREVDSRKKKKETK